MSLFCLFVVLYSVMSVVLYSVMSVVSITANINSIPMLNDSNFKSWQENLLIVLTVMDLDIVLRVDFPPPLADESTLDDKKDIERCERSNRMCDDHKEDHSGSILGFNV